MKAKYRKEYFTILAQRLYIRSRIGPAAIGATDVDNGKPFQIIGPTSIYFMLNDSTRVIIREEDPESAVLVCQTTLCWEQYLSLQAFRKEDAS